MTLRRLATLSATVLRATMTSGKRGAATVHLSGLQVVPLQPASPEMITRFQLQTPHQVLETYAVGHLAVQTGDVLVVDGNEYTIRGVGRWTPPGNAIGQFTHLVVEDVQL